MPVNPAEVRSVSPASGTIGAEVTITGSEFLGVTEVRFGAAPSVFRVDSASEIIATVPAGASTGAVEVTGPRGTASSPNAFTVIPGISLSVGGGLPATSVTVSGIGFGAYEAVDIYFGIAIEALASASGTGDFGDILVQVPGTAVPGRAYLTAIGRHSGLSAQAQFLVESTVTVTNPGPQASAAGNAVTLQIQASDSASGQTLTYTATGLPPGLSINSTGLITGTPSAGGHFEATVTAQDTTGASGSAVLGWAVHNTVTVTDPGPQASAAGNAVTTLQIQASDSASGQTLTYTATGLPPGLSLNSTGLITGTPSAGGDFEATVTAQDTTGASGSAVFEWTVSG